MKMLMPLITFQQHCRLQKVMRLFTHQTNWDWHFKVNQNNLGNKKCGFPSKMFGCFAALLFLPFLLTTLERLPAGISNQVLLCGHKSHPPASCRVSPFMSKATFISHPAKAATAPCPSHTGALPHWPTYFKGQTSF